MVNGFYSNNFDYYKISRNGEDDQPNIQIRSFCQYLRSITFPFQIVWESRLKTLLIVQVPDNFSESFCEVFTKQLQNFSIKKFTEEEVDIFINENSQGGFIQDSHSCPKMSDAQNDEPDVKKFFMRNELDGWHFEIEFYEADSVDILINYCPFCGKRLRD
ncbi:hypothetical protein SBF1_1570005 [Candidatus Desulfosporosinus infrequens]|uniref:Uncharacterized protein n=1 Tax=Candidatus Desulfosporosinus infrequens TaxID=2043169 RepID=A0A2U3K898_9FIRM|nr:hypothetical protein SBF1_1570005 [Candidatus Desulfosporosinus infrequens]